mmetsp:Transcript_132271/g.313561  ORF Transcript_132271/g.313561 Transcript_132271/m.313561 type:complete len:253 (+) Transcript_132271:2011-2769(+)
MQAGGRHGTRPLHLEVIGLLVFSTHATRLVHKDVREADGVVVPARCAPHRVGVDVHTAGSVGAALGRPGVVPQVGVPIVAAVHRHHRRLALVVVHDVGARWALGLAHGEVAAAAAFGRLQVVIHTGRRDEAVEAAVHLDNLHLCGALVPRARQVLRQLHHHGEGAAGARSRTQGGVQIGAWQHIQDLAHVGDAVQLKAGAFRHHGRGGAERQTVAQIAAVEVVLRVHVVPARVHLQGVNEIVVVPVLNVCAK